MVLAEAHVQLPVQLVLHAPVATDRLVHRLGVSPLRLLM